MKYNKLINHGTQTEQSLLRNDEIRNAAGGYVFKTSIWSGLDRFLILGTETPTYYAGARDLTKGSLANLEACIKEDVNRTVKRITELSVVRPSRLVKQGPAMLALAKIATTSSEARRLVTDALPQVARIPTFLFEFLTYYTMFNGGWGRSFKNAIANLYSGDIKDLTYHMIKYQSREGWSHRDVLRLCHAKPVSEAHKTLFAWATQEVSPLKDYPELSQLNAFLRIKETNPEQAAQLIAEYKLPWECVPTQHLNSPMVWEALLPHMGVTACMRNLGKMTSIGLLDRGHNVNTIMSILDSANIIKGRVHPLSVLVASNTYGLGHGVKGSLNWVPNPNVIAKLNEAFYAGFKAVPSTNKNYYLGIDISGSMSSGPIAGLPGICPRNAAAIMAMVTHRAEENTVIRGFSSYMQPLNFSKTDDYPTVVGKMTHLNFGATDCAVAIKDAMKNSMPIDTFIIYTDNETWAGETKPFEALQQYREKMGIDAKLISVGFTATESSIADPKDPNMLDIVGFDTSAPEIIRNFSL